MPQARYAATTNVSRAKSTEELETLLSKHGATSFIAGTHEHHATIAFQIRDLRILMRVPLPDPKNPEFTATPTGGTRATTTAHRLHTTAVHATWRALLLLVKAKLVAVDQGVTTIEQEFLPHLLLPDGSTFADHALTQIRQAYATGQIPPLLPHPPRPAIEG
jgi:hypothetical protein